MATGRGIATFVEYPDRSYVGTFIQNKLHGLVMYKRAITNKIEVAEYKLGMPHGKETQYYR